MKRRHVLRIAVALIGAIALLAIGLLLYVNFADLSGWRDTVARLASDAIGRELRIDGEFHPEIGFTTRVVATDISLANADWSGELQMVSVERLVGEIDLLSIFFGPITIRDIEIDGARVLFEVNADGSFNWDLGSGETGDGGGGDIELAIGHALVTDANLVYARPQDQTLEAALAKLEFTDNGTGMLDLEVEGVLGGAPLELSGRLGTFIGLINATSVEHQLSGKLGNIEFTTNGSIADLATLGGADLTARVGGDDLTVVAEFLDHPRLPVGSFYADLAVRPAAAGSHLELDASAGDITAKVTGVVDSLVKPTTLDVTVAASGTDISKIGSLAGVEDLPEESLSVSGRVHWAGFPLTCDNIEIRIGKNSLSAHGVVGEPPLMLGTDFSFDGGGPDFSTIAALAGRNVPREPYTVTGRLVRHQHGIGGEKIVLEVGDITFEADGVVGDPPEYDGTALTFRGNGPDLARLQSLVGIELPSEPFEVGGRLAKGGAAIDLDAVRARVGGTTLQISGQLSAQPGLVGTDLRLEAEGPDASQLAAIADVPSVPAEAFRVDGGIRVLDTGYQMSTVTATLGSLAVKGSGTVAPPPKMIGSDLHIHIEDTDLSHPAAIVGIAGLPADFFAIDTRLRIDPSGYHFEGLAATVSDMEVEADAVIPLAPELEGTELSFAARGPRLESLNPFLGQSGLPSAPFSASGRVRIVEGSYALDDVVAEVDGSRVTLNGTVRPVRGVIDTDLEIETSIPDLRRLGELVSGLIDLPELPQEPLTLTTRLVADESGYAVDHLRASLGKANVVVDGRVGLPPGFIGTDLTIDGDGPDASLFKAVTGVTIPVAPFQLNGRVEKDGPGFRFHNVNAQLGEYRVELDGALGELPKLIGTDLTVQASGPGTGLLQELAGVSGFPDQPFGLEGGFSGTTERFASRDFSLRFGPSDLEGSFAVDITGKPEVTARLTSTLLDLSRLREHLETKGTTTEESAKVSTPGAQKRLFRDDDLALEGLKQAHADVEIRISSLVLPAKNLHDVTVDVQLADGRLEIERVAAIGQDQGRINGNLVLEPIGDQYRLRTWLDARQLRLDLPGSPVDRSDQPPIDIEIDLEAVGSTPHELASSTNGALQLVVGTGVMDSRLLDLATADFLLTLLNAFNPFAKQGEATELQCGVALLSIEDGIATLEPMAFQSDKMTLLGDGKIDLRTEKLNLHWITKPRKGLGISASMLTNPYIKLGGTLADPSIELKPLEAVTSTGVAVATMGISLVAKGMFDRIMAEKKVCKKALKEIEARTQTLSGPPVRTK
jgi:uncharacterized protein involved in outer membrane biogenesis